MAEIPEWVSRLELAPHPEGGFFRETWRSELTLTAAALPADYGGPRAAGTAILFVLLPGQESAWHTVRSAELWLHHRGSPSRLWLAGHDALLFVAALAGAAMAARPMIGLQ